MITPSPSRKIFVTVVAVLAASLAVGPRWAAAETVSGTATVVDAETLEIDGRQFRLRGIDAPEPGQRCLSGTRDYDCGRIAATALMDLVAGGTVTCQPLAVAPAAGATAATAAPESSCRSDGYDLSEGMVYTGWAMADPATGGAYRAIERGAKSKRRGMWRGAFIAPWQWRAAMAVDDSGLTVGNTCGVGKIVITKSSTADCDLFRLTGGAIYDLPRVPRDPPQEEICLCGRVVDSDPTCAGRSTIRDPRPHPRRACP